MRLALKILGEKAELNQAVAARYHGPPSVGAQLQARATVPQLWSLFARVDKG